MKLNLKLLFSQFLKLVFLVFTSAAMQKLAITHASVERGYKAFGGEYLVFPIMLIVGYFCIFYIPAKLKEDIEC